MSGPYLKNVLVVGAGGQVGGHIVKELLGQGKHNVSALTRPDSSAIMPQGLHTVKKADYDQHSSLVSAMQGEDVLVITMNAMAPPESSTKLIDAAVAAGIKYIVPNEWASDYEQVSLGKDIGLANGQLKIREYIESKGATWISIGCGFWYSFSLAGTEIRYGFDFANRKLTLYGDGTTKITTTTWPQTALALAKVLALPLASTSGLSIEQVANRQVLVTSFYVSQRDMLESVLRVTGTQESDWTITYEDAKERFQRGQQMMQSGNFVGFGIAMYARAFFPEDPMNHEAKALNDALGLPKEDFDAATKLAVEMAKEAPAY